jgi:hypothetical protein
MLLSHRVIDIQPPQTTAQCANVPVSPRAAKPPLSKLRPEIRKVDDTDDDSHDDDNDNYCGAEEEDYKKMLMMIKKAEPTLTFQSRRGLHLPCCYPSTAL